MKDLQTKSLDEATASKAELESELHYLDHALKTSGHMTSEVFDEAMAARKGLVNAISIANFEICYYEGLKEGDGDD